MSTSGDIVFFDTNCAFIEDNGKISVIPKEKDDIGKIRPHFYDKEFWIQYNGIIGTSTALIEEMQFGMDYVIRLSPRFIFENCIYDAISQMKITGEAIDDFFSPADYFYEKAKIPDSKVTDLIYHSEVADEWHVIFENQEITITLSYGDILSRGIGSDLMLHPKLTIQFERTSDFKFVYRIYSFVIRFLQIVRYDTKCGKMKIELFDKVEGKLSHGGKLIDFSSVQDSMTYGGYEIGYGNYKKYIQSFLQFSADNINYSFFHYPSNGCRYRGKDYSAIDFINIFSAFESECLANKDLYANADSSRIQKEKEKILTQIEETNDGSLTKDEKEFLENAMGSISKLGTEFGQTKKICNAYGVLHKALDNSVEQIFYLPEFRLKGKIGSKEIRAISKFLASKRGAIAHGGYIEAFSDVDAQKIRFLEILTYAQMLYRVGLDFEDIERITGAIFGCNQKMFTEKMER